MSTNAVLFDWDGTITDTEKYYQVAWPRALEHFGYHMDSLMPLELRSLGRPYAPKKFKEWFGEDFDYDIVREYRKGLVRELIKEQGIKLKKGAIETLISLRSMGIHTAVVTANGRRRMDGYIEKLGLSDLFDDLICADMVERGKPAPDIYIHACEKLNIDPYTAIAVEDSPNGVKSAYDAGCRVVMVPDLTEPDDDIMHMLYARVDTLADIPGLV